MAPDAASQLLTAEQEAFLRGARSGVLGTIAPDGTARLVPVCFALLTVPAPGLGDDVATPAGTPPRLYVPLDEKPKRVTDPRALARVRDILARPAVTVLVERWDEDWSQLAWLRLGGSASLLEPEGAARPEHAAAVGALRARYTQYREHRLEARPLIRIVVTRAASWGSLNRATGPD